jgi:hypothetical protein
LPGTNPLAYYENPQITDVNCFLTLAHGPSVINIFCL